MQRDPLLQPLPLLLDGAGDDEPSSADPGTCVTRAFATLVREGFAAPEPSPLRERPLILIGTGGSLETRRALVEAGLRTGHPVMVVPRELIEDEPPKVADLLRTQLTLKRFRSRRQGGRSG